MMTSIPYNEIHFISEYEPEIFKSEPPIYPLNLIQLLRRSPNLSLFSAPDNLACYRMWWVTTMTRSMTVSMESPLPNKIARLETFYNLIMEPAASVTLNDVDIVSAAEMINSCTSTS